MISMILYNIKFLLSLLPSLDFVVPAIQPINDVLNIFAWARVFLPVDLIAVLLGLTAAFYAFKASFNIIKFILQAL